MARVLVVDDEFGIAELLQAVLEDEGHTVMTASNGQHGLHLVETGAPDIVFLDYMMPVMNGAVMLGRLAETHALPALPVVMMSSIAEESVAARCAGYALFLRKPFD